MEYCFDKAIQPTWTSPLECGCLVAALLKIAIRERLLYQSGDEAPHSKETPTMEYCFDKTILCSTTVEIGRMAKNSGKPN